MEELNYAQVADGGDKHPNKGQSRPVQTPDPNRAPLPIPGGEPVTRRSSRASSGPDYAQMAETGTGDSGGSVLTQGITTQYDDMSKYNSTMRVGEDNSIRRADDQSKMAKAFNAVVGGVIDGGLGFVKDASYLLDWTDTANMINGIDTLGSNWAADKATKAQAAVDSAFPIYKPNNDGLLAMDSGNIFGALHGLISSTIEFGAMGATIAGVVGAGVEALNGVGLASLLYGLAGGAEATADVEAAAMSIFQKGSAKVAGFLSNEKVADMATRIGSGAFNNIMMGKVLGLQSYDNVKQRLQSDVDNGLLTKEEVEQMAVKAGNQVELYNKMFLMSDMVALRGLFGVKKGVTNALEKTYQNLSKQGLDVTEAMVDEATEKAKSASYGFMNGVKEVGKSSAIATTEMMGQSIIQKQAEYGAEKTKGVEDKTLDTSDGARYANWLDTKDTVLQGILGLLGGPLGHGLTSAIGGKGAKIHREHTLDLQGDILKQNLDAIKTNMEVLVKGVKMKETTSTQEDTEHSDKVANNLVFTELAAVNLANGTVDHLRALLNDAIRMTPEEAKEKGMDDDYKQQALDLHTELGKMEKSWMRSSQYHDNVGMFEAEQNQRLTEGLVHHLVTHDGPTSSQEWQTKYEAMLLTPEGIALKRQYKMPNSPQEATDPDFIASLPEGVRDSYTKSILPKIYAIGYERALYEANLAKYQDDLVTTKAKILEMKTPAYQKKFLADQRDIINEQNKKDKKTAADSKRTAAEDKAKAKKVKKEKKAGTAEATPATPAVTPDPGKGSSDDLFNEDGTPVTKTVVPDTQTVTPDSKTVPPDSDNNSDTNTDGSVHVPHVKAAKGELSPKGTKILSELTLEAGKVVDHNRLKPSQVAAHMPGDELNAKAVHEEIVDHLSAKKERESSLGDISKLSSAVKRVIDEVQKEKGTHIKSTDVTRADVEKHLPKGYNVDAVHEAIIRHLEDREWAAKHGPQEPFKEKDKVIYQDHTGKEVHGVIDITDEKGSSVFPSDPDAARVKVRNARMAHVPVQGTKPKVVEVKSSKQAPPTPVQLERIENGPEKDEHYLHQADGLAVKATKPSWIGESIKKLLKGKSVKELRESLKAENHEATLKWIADNSKNGTDKQNQTVLKALQTHLDAIDGENISRIEAYDRVVKKPGSADEVQKEEDLEEDKDPNDAEDTITGEETDGPVDVSQGNGADTDPDHKTPEEITLDTLVIVGQKLQSGGGPSDTSEEEAASAAATQKALQDAQDTEALAALAAFNLALEKAGANQAPVEFNLLYSQKSDSVTLNGQKPKEHLAIGRFTPGELFEVKQDDYGLAVYNSKGERVGAVPPASKKQIEELMVEGEKLMVRLISVGEGGMITDGRDAQKMGKVSDRYPNKALKLATVSGGEPEINGEPFTGVLAPYGALKQLGVYAVVPIGKNQKGQIIYRPVWVSKDKIGTHSDELQSLLLAARIWSDHGRGPDTPSIHSVEDLAVGKDGLNLIQRFQKSVHESLGFDITTNAGLRDYFERFLFNTNVQEHERSAADRKAQGSERGERTVSENPLLTHLNNIAATPDVHALSISGSSIRFGEGGHGSEEHDGVNRASVYEFFPGEYGKPITQGGLTYGQRLEQHLKETYFHFHNLSAQEGEKYSVPVVSPQGEVYDINKGGDYNSYVKTFTNTAGSSSQLASGDSVYTYGSPVKLQVVRKADTQTPLEKVKTEKAGKVQKIREGVEKLSKKAAAALKAGKTSVQAVMDFPDQNGKGVGHPAAVQIVQELVQAGVVEEKKGETPNSTTYKAPEDPAVTEARRLSSAKNRSFNPFFTPAKPVPPTQEAVIKLQIEGLPSIVHLDVVSRISQDLWIKASREGIKEVNIDRELAGWKNHVTEMRDGQQKLVDLKETGLDPEEVEYRKNRLDYLNAMIEHWDQVEDFSLRALERIGGVIVRDHIAIEGTVESMLSNNDHQGAPTDTLEVQNEKSPERMITMDYDPDADANGIDANFDDSAKLQQDGKLGVSGRMRGMLNFVPDWRYDELGNIETISDFFGMPRMVGFDRTYNEVTSALSGTGAVFEAQMDRLRTFFGSNPYFEDLIKVLEAASPQVRYEFASAFNKENINMQGILYSQHGEDTTIKLSITDETTKVGAVLSGWKARANVFGVFDSIPVTGNNDAPKFIINKAKRDAAMAVYSSLMKQFKENGDSPAFRKDFGDWMKSIGVQLSKPAIDELFDTGLKTNKGLLKPREIMSPSNINSPIVKLANYLKGVKGVEGLNSDKFLTPIAVRQLATLEAKYNKSLVASTGKSAGKILPMDHFGRPTSNRTNELKNDGRVAARLLFDPYTKHATWLSKLVRRSDDAYPDKNGNQVAVGDYLDTEGNKLMPGGNADLLKDSQFYSEFTSGTGALQILKREGQVDDDSSSMHQLDPLGQEMTRAGFLFLDTGNSNHSQRYGTFLHPTMSDKSTILHIRSVMNDYKMDLFTGKLHPESVRRLYDLMVQSEVDRIAVASAKIKAGETVHQAGFDQGRKMFHMFHEFNDMEDIWHDKAKAEMRHASEILTPAVEEQRDQEGNITQAAVPQVTVHEAMVERFGDMLEKIIDQKVEQWKKLGMIETRKGTQDLKDENGKTVRIDGKAVKKEETRLKYINKEYVEYAKSRNNEHHARLAAADFELNSMEANVNSFMLYNGDIAQFYKGKGVQGTWENAIKRFAADMALSQKQGYLTRMENAGASFRMLHMRDIYQSSKIMDQIREIYKDHPDKIAAYERINTADGQEYVTLKEHLDNMVGMGRMTEKHRDEIIARDNKYELVAKDWDDILSIVVPGQKPVTAGNQADEHTGGERKIYIKTSSFPLTKTVTRGMELDNLRQFMEENDIQRATFESGWKVGAPLDSLKIHNDKDGSLRTKAEMQADYNQDAHSLKIKRDLFGYQQEMPVDLDHDTISRATQVAAQAFTNIQHLADFDYLKPDGTKMSGMELKAEYDKTYGELFRAGREKLEKDLGVDKEGNPNIQKLQALMAREAISRDYGTNEREALELVDKGVIGLGGKQLILPLYSRTDNKIEAMLQSMITKRIVKFKMPGDSGVLVSEAGFRGTNPHMVYPDGKDVNGVEVLPGYDAKLGLLPSRKDPVTGKILPAQVFLPYRFKALMKEIARQNEAGSSPWVEGDTTYGKDSISPEVLTMMGFRIPAQGLNSQSAMQCVGFLPESAVNNIVAPSDFITQMGSDFDVDKLYMYQYHNQLGGMVDGKWDPRVVRYQGDDAFKIAQNKLIDMHLAILSHEGVQSAIKNPNDTTSLAHIANRIVKIRTDASPSPWSFNGITSMYQSEQLQAAAAGKSGLSVYSRDSVFIANAQNKGLKVYAKVGQSIQRMEIAFGGQKFEGDLYPIHTLDGSGSFVSDENLKKQSAAADNVKDPILSKLHINETTMPVDRAMIAMGFTSEVSAAFLNQPIIREYVEKLVSNQSPVRGLGNKAYALTLEHIAELYPADYIDSKGNTRTYTDSDRSGVAENASYANKSTQEMEDIIARKTTDQTDQHYNLSQRALLSRFLQLKSLGETISDAEGIVGTASSGLKPSAMESYIQESKLSGLRALDKGDVTLYGSESLLGDYTMSIDGMGGEKESAAGTPFYTHKELTDQGYHYLGDIGGDTGLGHYFKPTTYAGHATMEGLIKGNALWRKAEILVYDTPVYKGLMDVARQITGGQTQSTTREVEMQSKVMDGLKSLLYSTPGIGFGPHTGESRRRLFFDNKETGSKSLATEIMGYSEQGWYQNNQLMKRLSSRIAPEGMPSLVQMIDSGAGTFDQDQIYLGYLDLLNNSRVIDPETGRTTADLARDLAAAGYLAGGNQGYTDYLSHIAVSATEESGFNEAMRGIDFNDIRSFYPGFDLHEAVIQIIRHNPEMAVVKHMDDFHHADDGSIVIKKTKDGFTAQDHPAIIKVMDDEGTGQLYQSVDRINEENVLVHSHFEPVGTLGSSYFQEYDISQTNPRSLVEQNNVQGESSIPSFLHQPEQVGLVHEQRSETLKKGVTPDMGHAEILHTMLDNIADHTTENGHSGEIHQYNRELAAVFSKLTFPGTVTLHEGNAPSYDWATGKLTMTRTDMGSTVAMVDNLLHEVTHVFTAKALHDHISGVKTSKEAKAVVDFHAKIREAVHKMYSPEQVADFNSALQAFTSSTDTERPGIVSTLIERGYEPGAAEDMARTLYGVTSPTEMVAMVLKDATFQKALNNIPFKSKMERSLWDHLKELLGDMLRTLTGVDIKKGSALEIALYKSMDLIGKEGSRSTVARKSELTARAVQEEEAQAVINERKAAGKVAARDASIPAQRELKADGIIEKAGPVEGKGRMVMVTRRVAHPEIEGKTILDEDHYIASKDRIESMTYPDGTKMFTVQEDPSGRQEPTVIANPNVIAVDQNSKVAEFAMMKGRVTEGELLQHLKDIGILSDRKYTGEHLLETRPKTGEDVSQRSIAEQNLAAITHINDLYNGELFDIRPLGSGYRVRVNRGALKEINQERGLSPGNKRDLGMAVSGFKYTLSPEHRTLFDKLRDEGRLTTRC